MKKLLVLLLLCSCSKQVAPNIFPETPVPPKLCDATFTDDDALTQDKADFRVFVYPALGGKTVDQLRCLISTYFSTANFINAQYDFRVLTFYSRSTGEGLIYYFSKEGVLGVLVVSLHDDGNYTVRLIRYKGSAIELSKIFDVGSVYIPFKLKISDKAAPLPKENLYNVYRTYGNVDLESLKQDE